MERGGGVRRGKRCMERGRRCKEREGRGEEV